MLLIQGRNYVTKLRTEPRSYDQGRRNNDAFAFMSEVEPLGIDRNGLDHHLLVVLKIKIRSSKKYDLDD